MILQFIEPMPIQSSENYIWSTDDCLGSGAAGHVYLGRHRVSATNYSMFGCQKHSSFISFDAFVPELAPKSL